VGSFEAAGALPGDDAWAGPVNEPEETGASVPPDAAAGDHVLVVDDDPFIARLLEIELRASGYDVAIASDGKQALDLVNDRIPALILADVMMPNMDGLELTRRIRADARTAPVSIILLTARGLSADKLAGLSVGADDYIVKPFDTPELLARIRGVLRRAKEMRAQSPLTGLPGNVRIEEEIESRVSQSRDFAILYADLDNFKAYNDHYGFMRGDQVIQFTARLLQDVTLLIAGGNAFVGHVGGDDFVIACEPEHAMQIAEQVVGRFDKGAPELYDESDRERGFIEVTDRRGEVQRFAMLSISIGVATTDRRGYSHYAEAVAVATEMKTFTKTTEGSSWAVDRRTS